MIQNDTKKVAKSCKFYRCEKCDYVTSRLSSWRKHIETIKHKKGEMILSVQLFQTPEMDTNYACQCGKTYSKKNNLCRHKKKCEVGSVSVSAETVTEETDEGISNTQARAIVKKLGANAGYGSDEELVVVPKQFLYSIIERATEPKIVYNGNVSITNNSLNLFLNQKCSDAMTIQDFARKMLVSISDLDGIKADCLAQVIINNLKPLSLTERPFHCTDIDRSEWFVKDADNGWEEDNGTRIITAGEHGIARKWPSEFEAAHPGWQGNDKLKDKYVRLAGAANANLQCRDVRKVLQEVSEQARLETTALAVHSKDMLK